MAAESKYTIGIEVKDGGSVKVFDALGTAVKDAGSAAGQASRKFSSAESSFSKLGASIISINQGLDLASRAFGIASSAARTFAGFLNDASARADDFGDLAKKVGLSAKFLSELEIAARTSGSSVEGLASGLKALARNATAASTGNKELQGLFLALGADSKRASSDFAGFFEQVAKGFAALPAGPERTAAAIKLMKGAGADLLPTLEEIGTKGLGPLRREAEALGLVLEDTFVDASDRYQDALVKIEMASLGVKTQLAEGFVPVLADLSERFLGVITTFDLGNGALTRLGEAFGQLLAGPASAFIDYLDRVLTASKGNLAEGLRTMIVDGIAMVADGAIAAGAALGQAIGDAFAAALTTRGKQALAWMLSPASWASPAPGATSTGDTVRASIEAAMPPIPPTVAADTAASNATLDQRSAALDRLRVALGKASEAESGAAAAVQKTTDATKAELAALDQEIAKLTITHDTLTRAAAAGHSYEEAQREITDALLVNEAAQRRASGATEEQTKAWLEASRQAVALERAIGDAEEQMKQTEKASQDAAKGMGSAFGGVADTFSQAIGESFDAVISGTRGLGDVWEGMLLSIAKQGFEDLTGQLGDGLESLFGEELGKEIGEAAATAVKGAAIGYASTNVFGSVMGTNRVVPVDPQNGQILPEAMQKQANMIGQAVGAVVGAAFSVLLTGIGGLAGGFAGGAVQGQMREYYLQGTPPGEYLMGEIAPFFLGFTKLLDIIFEAVVDRPTFGTMLRKSGLEQMFGEETAFGRVKKQAGFGPRAGNYDQTDYEISPENARRLNAFSYIYGSNLAMASAEGTDYGKPNFQDKTRGLSEGFFNLIARWMDNVGLDDEEVKRLLAQEMADMGIGAVEVVEGINRLFEFQRRSIAGLVEGEPIGVGAFADVLLGGSEMVGMNLPRGVNMQSVALGAVGKKGDDGTWSHMFGDMTQEKRELLLAITQDAKTLEEVMRRLAEAGFSIDVERFEADLKHVIASATVVGASLSDAIFNSESANEAMAKVMQSLGDDVRRKVGDGVLASVLDETMIGAVFAPVYEVLDKIKDVDFTSQEATSGFMAELVPAIAAGKANLAEYIPMLKQMILAAKEIDEALEEALKPTELEAFFLAYEAWMARIKESIPGIISGAIMQGVEQGFTREQIITNIGDRLREVIGEQILEGIINGFIVAGGLAERAAALGAKTFKYYSNDGKIDAKERAELEADFRGIGEAGVELMDILEESGVLDILYPNRNNRRSSPGFDWEGVTSEMEQQIVATAQSFSGAMSSAVSDAFVEGMEMGLSGNALDEHVGKRMRDVIRQQVFLGMLQAIIAAVGLNDYIVAWGQALGKALADGVITADEQMILDAFVAGAEHRIRLIGDMVDDSGIADLVVTSITVEDSIASSLSSAVASALQEGVRSGLTGEALKKFVGDKVQTVVYNAMLAGLIDAILTMIGMEAYLIAWANSLVKIFADGVVTAEEQVLMDAWLNGFRLRVNEAERIVQESGIADLFLPTEGEVEQSLRPIEDRTDRVNEDICAARCDTERELATVEAGRTFLSGLGRYGNVDIEAYLPHYAHGGIATHRQVAVVGENGPELIVPLSSARGSGLGGDLRALAAAIEAQPSHVTVTVDRQVLLDVMAKTDRLGRKARRPMVEVR